MDPLQLLLTDPSVPEKKRLCSGCGEQLHHEKGFCPMCGTEYCFVPTLKAGDVVGGQYEVRGAMAFGGLGWIYLGWDKTLQRWVVLKGLLNSKDEASAAAALAERQFLAAVKHPKIVGIYNFVTQGNEGYIVMEYVGGKTIKAIRQERGPLPVAEAIAYMHAILPAFGYLERQGLVYCDFKPDNVMLEDDDVKLIDMGGVRRADDTQGDIYGTRGYSAPEADSGPSFVSDLYTVARTLAILMMDFKFQGTYEFSLPTPAEQPIFAKYDSLYRFLLKATHKDPDERFQTADEMGDQLIGVLREVVADTGTPRAIESSLFYGDPLTHVDEDDEDAGDTSSVNFSLPPVKTDPTDTASNVLMAAGSTTGDLRRATLERAMKQYPDSLEAPLQLAETLIKSGGYGEGERYLAHVIELNPFDWRVAWYRGISFGLQQRWKDAYVQFDKVYSELPGELAPKLALAETAEHLGDYKAAIVQYDLISRVDPGYVSAAFGLARCHTRSGDKPGVVQACTRVAATSSLYTSAQMMLARALLKSEPTPPGAAELAQASEVIRALTIDGLKRHRLAADLLLTAIDRIKDKTVQPNSAVRLLDEPLQIRALQFGAERELRACARHVKTDEERIRLVDEANRVRPRTLV